jgi:hypothetical protein
MARSASALLIAAATLVTGCGSSPETVGQVRDRYRTPVSSLRMQLQTLPSKMPAQVSSTNAMLTPAPVYNEDGSGNTDFLAIEHLTDTDAKVPVDLALAHQVKTALAWTGAGNFDDPTARRAATADVEATFKTALETRYLVVLRSSRGKIVGEGKVFTGGDAIIEAFVVDLKSGTVVASTSARGAATGPVQVDLPAGAARTERANSLITAAAIAEVRTDLAAKLTAATGGTFNFTKRRSVLAASS